MRPEADYGSASCGFISIHAPLAGCDSLIFGLSVSTFRFQSTHPLRGATIEIGTRFVSDFISIHAPLAGCDYRMIYSSSKGSYFNPRTPCGVRRDRIGVRFPCRYFNPRTPCGVRLRKSASRTQTRTFQSTHPLRGATGGIKYCEVIDRFQSTHPLRGATWGVRPLCVLKSISIHAPLAGCDQLYASRALKSRIFQSTHPLRGATCRDRLVLEQQNISIHAPLAGCDCRKDRRKHVQHAFQSTHPLRGATFLPRDPVRSAPYFNPRTPCGVRHTVATREIFFNISIHAPLAGCDSKIAEIFPANLRKSYKISAKPNKERRCHVLGKGKAAAISDLARCEPPGENRNTSGSHQIMSAPSGA